MWDQLPEKMHLPQGVTGLVRVPWEVVKVEAGGIEPPSESDSQRLLRAQSRELISPRKLPRDRIFFGQLMKFSSPAYEHWLELIPICVAWVRPYGLEPVRRQRT